MHMIKRWCFVDMSYQHLPTDICIARGRWTLAKPRSDRNEGYVFNVLGSFLLVPILSCLDWLNHLDLGSLMFICVFGQFNASCSCTLHRACLRRQDLRNLAPCGMWYVEGTISWSRARYAHLPQRAKGYCMLLQYIARRLELMWYVVVLCGPLISHC